MKPTPTANGQYRLGSFELNIGAGELHNNGLRVRLQGQPLEVLAMLVERPQEVVTREELRLKLWPADTFVDFDRGLNRAINKLREALGDDAENPRYIQTIPRRGYRLIAPVNGGAALAPAQGRAQEGPSPKRRTWKTVAAAWWPVAVLVVALGAVLGYWVAQPQPVPRVTQIVRLTHDRLNKGQMLATDGSRVYFSEQSSLGIWTPVMVSAKGGETTPIRTSLEQSLVLDVSADGSEVLVREMRGQDSEGRLWALPSTGGSPRQVGNLVALEATWSPDGQELLLIHDRQLFVAQGDGSGPRKFPAVPGDPYFIRWSPDGRRITVSLADGKSNQLWEAMADGRNLHPVLPNWNFAGASCSGHWTPDGRYLLFDSFRDGPDEVWALREQTSLLRHRRGVPVRLTQGPANFGRPVPSKDGKTVFAVAWEDDSELMRYDARTKQYLPYLPALQARTIDFTRDGKWVVYPGPDNNLWRARMDGTEQLQLTFPPMQASAPHWSPEGGRIAFVGSLPGKMGNVFVVSASGGVAERVTPPEMWVDDPTWSPDGRRLAFYGYSTTTDDALHLVDTQTRQESKIPGSDSFYAPHWSPDGRHIAARCFNSQKIPLYDVSTEKWRILAEAAVESLAWSGDGKYLYGNVGGKRPGIIRMTASDGRLERVAELQALLPNPINWFGLGPDDSLLVSRGTGSADIYALAWEAP